MQMRKTFLVLVVCTTGLLVGTLHPNLFGLYWIRDASTLELSSVLYDQEGKPAITTSTTLSFQTDGTMARKDVRTVHDSGKTSAARIIYDPSSGLSDVVLETHGIRLVRPMTAHRRRILLNPSSSCLSFSQAEDFTGRREISGLQLEVFRREDDQGVVERLRSPQHGCFALEQRTWGTNGRLVTNQRLVHAQAGVMEALFDVGGLPLVEEPPEEFLPARMRARAETDSK